MSTSAEQADHGDTFYNDPSPPEKRRSQDAFFDHKPNDNDLPIQGTTGPVGEPGLPPARPSSSQRPASRTALRPSTATPKMTSQAGSRRESWTTELSRPGTANSRSHVANVTAPTFFRPMSSRHLREDNTRNTSPALYDRQTAPRVSEETTRSRRVPRTRYSDASIVTMDHNGQIIQPDDVPPLPTTTSSGLRIEDFSEKVTAQPLRDQSSHVALRAPDESQAHRVGAGDTTASHKTTSKRTGTSLAWNSFRMRGDRKDPKSGHQRLESEPMTPNSALEETHNNDGLGRNYEYYNGNAVFFLHGRLINTRQKPLNALTGLLAVLPAILFFAFSAPWIWHNISPAIPITFAYVFFVCISAFLHASFSDPGVLPRNIHPHPPVASDEDPLWLGPSQSDWVMVGSRPGTSSESANTAIEVPVKYCKSCNIWRPPRAHHCRVCDACIETQDHHCMWLNNCVGRRNYRQFFTFIAFGAILAIYLFGASLAHIVVFANRNDISFGQSVGGDWTRSGALAMVIYSILASTYPISLCGYHIFLAARGESTREYLNSHKFLKKDRHRPFDQRSYAANLIALLFRPRPPSYLQFKNHYSPGDLRFGNSERKKDRQAGAKNDVELNNMKGT